MNKLIKNEYGEYVFTGRIKPENNKFRKCTIVTVEAKFDPTIKKGIVYYTYDNLYECGDSYGSAEYINDVCEFLDIIEKCTKFAPKSWELIIAALNK